MKTMKTGTRLVVKLSMGAGALGLLSGCSAGATDSFGAGTGGGGDGGPGQDTPSDGGLVIDGSTSNATDPSCASETYGATRVPANVLLLVDRSASMTDCPGGGSCAESKWDGAGKAITGALGASPPELRVGLVFFPAAKYPGYNDCRNCLTSSMMSGQVSAACDPILQDCGCLDVSAVPDVPVDTLAATLPAIESAFANSDPDYNTPTYHALGAAYQILSELQTGGDRYVLLVTDGDPTVHELTKKVFVPPANWYDQPERYGVCMDLPDILARAQSAVAGAPPIKTFIVGTPGVTNTAFLSDLAVAGGTPRSDGCQGAHDCHHQIGASDFAADLQAVLTDIAGQVATCTFALPLDSAEVDPNKVNVSYRAGDDEPEELYRDPTHQDGWDYTDSSQQKIELFGPACEGIKANTESEVSIELGCKTRVK